MNVYQENGYTSRREYLNCLAEDYGLPVGTVFALAEMLGESEDFDGLVSACEDAEEMGSRLDIGW